MAVDPARVDEITATVAALYREAETALVRIMAHHLEGDLDSEMQAPEWAERKLAAVRQMRASARAVLAALQADSGEAIRAAAADAYRHGWRSALAELPARWFPRSRLTDTADNAALPGFGAIESLANAVHDDLGERHRNVLRDVIDSYRDTISAASARVITGTHTRRHAAQSALRRFADRGITGFTDRAGRRWKLSTYAEMATRTVTQRAAVQGQTDRLDTLGARLVHVSDHKQECVLCRPFEGRVLRTDHGPTGEIEVEHVITGEPVTVDVVATLDAARLRGLQHPNCRHSISAFLPGVTKLPEGSTEDPEGDTARQAQRRIEREIRKHKSRQASALSDAERAAEGKRVREWQATMRQHLDDHPELKRLRYREQIGAGNLPLSGHDDPAGGIGPVTRPTLD